jgi:hypothetical protein
MNKLLTAAAAALSLLSLAAAPAYATVVGTPDSGNSIPLSGNVGGYYYQQIYSAANFSGATSIEDLTFYSSLYPNASGTVRTGAFQIYLATSTADIASFDTNNSAPWLDGSFTQVFDGTLGPIVDNKLEIVLSQAFNYDPSAGKLLLTIRNFSLSTDGNAFFDVDQNNGITNSRFSAYPYNWNQGLVTGFNEIPAPSVPEPATWAMTITGFGLVGGTLRRRSVRFASAI